MASPILTEALGTALGSPSMGGLPRSPAPEKRIGPSPEDDLGRVEGEIKSALTKREDLTTQLGKAVTAKAEYDLKEKTFAEEQKGIAAKKSKILLDNLESKIVNSADYKEWESNANKTAEELTFKPSQENAQTLALVFSVISASGFLLGGLSKKNAMSAMYAMNGLTEGYAKGREDLFKQQRQTFETNVKAMQERMKILKDKLDVGIKTLARDKERGELEIQAAMAEANADFLRSQKDARGVIATRDILENQINQLDKSLGFLKTAQERHRAQQLQGYWNQEKLDTQERLAAATNERLAQQFAASQKAAEERAAAAERRFILSQNAAQDRAEAAERRFMLSQSSKAPGGGKPPPANVQQAVQLRNDLIPELEKTLPVLERIQKQGDWPRFTALIGVEPRAAEFSFRNDPEAQKAIRTLSRFRSAEFETGGKALTKIENKILAPLYQAGFRDYNALKGAIEDGLEVMRSQKLAYERQYPQLASEVVPQPVAQSAPQVVPGKLTPEEQKELDELRKRFPKGASK
jgi:hypothetical protein